MSEVEVWNPLPTAPSRVRGTLLLALNLWVMWVCAYVEYLNIESGYMLPRTGPGKWRVAAKKSVAYRFRQDLVMRAEASGVQRSLEQELSPEEQSELDKELRESELNSNFRSFVTVPGLFQFFLAPLACICSLFVAFDAQRKPLTRIVVGLFMVTSATAFVRMQQLDYFGSLGW